MDGIYKVTEILPVDPEVKYEHLKSTVSVKLALMKGSKDAPPAAVFLALPEGKIEMDEVFDIHVHSMSKKWKVAGQGMTDPQVQHLKNQHGDENVRIAPDGTVEVKA